MVSMARCKLDDTMVALGSNSTLGFSSGFGLAFSLGFCNCVLGATAPVVGDLLFAGKHLVKPNMRTSF